MERDGHVLMINRQKKDEHYSLWLAPGGKVERNEAPYEAAVREVFEETGIDIELDSIVSLGHFSPSQFEKSNLYVVCLAKPLSYEINIIDKFSRF